MAAKRHTHKYHKIALGNVGRVWSCALKETGCTHHLPPYMESEILGRKSRCWNCDEEFILGPMSIQSDKPECPDCSGINKIASLVDDRAIAKLIGGK